MINSGTLERANKAKARRTHAERSHGENAERYGANARTGGSVVTVPEPIVRRDGMFTTRRMRDLAQLVGEYGGFVVSLHESPGSERGYAVSVHRRRDDKRRGFLSGPHLAEYILNNLDVLSHPESVLSVRRDRKSGHTFLSVCTVVSDLDRAKRLARAHSRDTIVRMADGRLCRVA